MHDPGGGGEKTVPGRDESAALLVPDESAALLVPDESAALLVPDESAALLVVVKC